MTAAWIPHYLARSSLWRWDDVRPGESGTYRMGSVSASVDHRDDEAADYAVIKDGAIVLEGACCDFDQAIKAVEDRLVAIGWLAPAPYGEERAA